MNKQAPILGFCAYSGTGKTTLLTALLPLLKANNIRVGVIKHAHHKFDTDQPGKDSYELRKAGAKQMLVSSDKRWVLINELFEGEQEAGLAGLVGRLDSDGLDLILVEGFKHEAFPKIELHRPELGKPPMYPHDDNVIAFATNATAPADISIPVLDLNQVENIAEFIVTRFLPGSDDNLE